MKKSASVKKLTNFRTFSFRASWGQNIPDDKPLTESFWVVRTNVRRETFLLMLKLGHLWGHLDSVLLEVLFTSNSLLEDDALLGAIKARQVGVQPKELLKRWNSLRNMGYVQYDISENLYFTLLGTTRWEVVLKERPIGRIKRYSGYIRTPSAKGSKRGNQIIRFEPEIFVYEDSVEFDYYTFLTVGEMDLDTGARFVSSP